MATIALSVRDVSTNPSGRLAGTSLLAQAQTLVANALQSALGPAEQHERLLFPSAVLAASPRLAEQARRAGSETAKGLLGFLRAATGLQSRAGELSARLAGILPAPTAQPAGTALFLASTRSSAGGTPQKNVGGALLADVRHQARSGIAQFTLRVDTRQEYALAVTVRAEDKNRDLLAKAASAINDAQPDVRATVEEASAGGAAVARLRLDARQPGEANRFALSDRVGDLVAYTRADRVRTPASDEQTGGETRDDPVAPPTLERLSDERQSEVLALVRQTLEALNEAVGNALAIPLRPEMALELAGAVDEAVTPLASAGVGLSAGGQFVVDESTLARALSAEGSAAATVGALERFASLLDRSAGTLAAQPPVALVEPTPEPTGPGPLAPSPTAPVSSLLRSYQVAQRQVEPLALAGLPLGGLLVNVAL
ncbi:MAG: hypothetical protein HY691_07210 [Chloroflexi bacterium]|nr:hypothetical protein [Chloroflexota bacterium]